MLELHISKLFLHLSLSPPQSLLISIEGQLNNNVSIRDIWNVCLWSICVLFDVFQAKKEQRKKGFDG